MTEVKIPIQVLNAFLDKRCFVLRVIELSAETTSYREAYERTEEEIEEILGVRKYADYNVFRVIKHREQRKGPPGADKNQLKIF